MWDWLWQQIMEQRAVVKAAPLVFGISVLLAGIFIFMFLEWFHLEKVETQEKRILLLTERLEEQIQATKVAAENHTNAKSAREAELRILIHDDERDPASLSDTNIWRWVWLKHWNADFTTDGSVARVARVITLNTLFISFTTPMTTSAVDIRSPDFTLPPYEVKSYTPRFAIITFEGKIPAGILEISMRP